MIKIQCLYLAGSRVRQYYAIAVEFVCAFQVPLMEYSRARDTNR
jgi:hypothetical protein